MDWRSILRMSPIAPAQAAQPEPKRQQYGGLGQGLVQGASDATRLYPMWQNEYINGNTQLQFTDWLADQGLANPAMPNQ